MVGKQNNSVNQTRRTITQVYKRDGKLVSFDQSKITNAIAKALDAVTGKNEELAKKLSDMAVELLELRFSQKIPNVEQIQDIVEEVFAKSGMKKIEYAYHVYRERRAEMRRVRQELGVIDEIKLTPNALQVLKRRYLLKDEAGHTIESTAQMFRRVAKAIAAVDAKYDAGTDVSATEEKFYEIMTNLEFLPNSPTLFNAGTQLGQLSACFVVPVEDSLISIFDAVKNTALIEQSGGGVGFSFSRLRPKGDIVRSTMGVASGPVSFMRVFDVTTEVIKAGGKRRGAMMGILAVDHPDILEFIIAKSMPGMLSNFNISVAITDKFMDALHKNKEYELINPRINKQVKKLSAKLVFSLITQSAWKTGDPGLIFIDEINRHNPTPQIGRIESTNPCGEVDLLPYESCNLGSINLSKFVKDGKLDWDKLFDTVNTAVHFLDNVIDANVYPMPEIEQITKANRKIGLGVMGFADMLLLLGIPYDSKHALSFAEKLMGFISKTAIHASIKLAEKRGSFPNFAGSVWDKSGHKAIRNAALTSIAPTGTISIIANSSSGIEPQFAIAYVREILEGTTLLEVNPIFEKIIQKHGLYTNELMSEISKYGSIKKIKRIPKKLKKLFVTALDIAPEWHVRMQAAFQKHVDLSVSKTVNLPEGAKPSDVAKIYMLAHKLKCKGITIYRYGSKPEQVLYIGKKVSVKSEYSGGCPTGVCPL